MTKRISPKALNTFLERQQQIKFRKNRQHYTDSKKQPPISAAQRAQILAHHTQMLHDLRTGKQLYLARHRANLLLQSVNILLAIYCDDALPELHSVYKLAQDELTDHNNGKINDLHWLEYLATKLFLDYMEFTPAIAVDLMGQYNAACQVIIYYHLLLQENPDELIATFRVIRGASLESVATKHQISQAKLRQSTLETAQALYRIGNATQQFGDILPANNLPDTRKSHYSKLTDIQTLKQLAKQAIYQATHGFENIIGMGLFDWDTWTRECKSGEYQLMQAAQASHFNIQAA